METCNKPVRTVDGDYRPCLCEIGHAGGCNPFSSSPNMAMIIPKRELPKGDRMPLTTTGQQGVIWTDQSTIRRCLWQGPHGRCIYELGNHTSHKEESQHGN